MVLPEQTRLVETEENNRQLNRRNGGGIQINPLEKRVIELTYRNGLTHLSSCLNTVNLLNYIYNEREENDPVILGNCHASLAHYVILEKHGYCDAQEMIDKHGVHASRDREHGIWVSGGSLGQPETVAVGLALADSRRTVWLVTSDGSTMEGATQEAIRFSPNCPNLKIFIVFNGFGAYSQITWFDPPQPGVTMYLVDSSKYPDWLKGLPGHYLKLTETQYHELMA